VKEESLHSAQNTINDNVLYELLIDNIMKVKENLGNRRDFPFPDDDKQVKKISSKIPILCRLRRCS